MESKNEHYEVGEHKVQVAISTTSGFSPTTGFETVSVKQKIDNQLHNAAKALKLTDVDGWIATVHGKVVNTQLSYEDNNLSGEVEIDWGPEHGGGGNA